jgi:hypothetical protein
MAKSERPKMGDLLKKVPEITTPVQEVRPVVQKSTEDEEKLNFFVPASLARKIKIHKAESGKSIKDISIEAYHLYFEQISK